MDHGSYKVLTSHPRSNMPRTGEISSCRDDTDDNQNTSASPDADHVSGWYQAEDDRIRRWTPGWWLGMFFILLVSLFWAASSVIVQHITRSLDYDRPFMITYIGSCVFVAFLPLHLGLSGLGLVNNPAFRNSVSRKAPESSYKALHVDRDGDSEDSAIHGGPHGIASIQGVPEDEQLRHGFQDARASSNGTSGDIDEIATTSLVISTGPNGSKQPKLQSHVFMMRLGLLMAPVWYFAQWTYVVSLADTSVTSSTIICNSSGLFTFVFNVLFKTETYSPLKATGVLVTLLGAIAVGLGDRDEGKESLWGDSAALLSAIAYGVYSMILRLWVPSDDEVSMPLVLGYMGLWSMLMFFPPVRCPPPYSPLTIPPYLVPCITLGFCVDCLGMHAVKWLPVLVAFALTPDVLALEGLSLNVLWLVVFKALLDNVLSELFWARAILLTTPTVATVGCSLTIPIAFVTDFVLHGELPNTLTVVGAMLVVGGFVFVTGGIPTGIWRLDGCRWRKRLWMSDVYLPTG